MGLRQTFKLHIRFGRIVALAAMFFFALATGAKAGSLTIELNKLEFRRRAAGPMSSSPTTARRSTRRSSSTSCFFNLMASSGAGSLSTSVP